MSYYREFGNGSTSYTKFEADGTDSFTGSCFLHNVGCHHECDTIGSRGQTSK